MFNWQPGQWHKWVTNPMPARIQRMRLQRETIARIALRSKPSLVLDAGCGYGQFSELLLQHLPQTRVVGIDLSQPMVKACSTSLPDRFVGCIADVTQLPFKTGAFDLVTRIGVLMHLADDAAAIRELARVVAPGGKLIVTFNNLLSPCSMATIAWSKIGERSGPRQMFRTLWRIRAELRRCGMKVLQTATDSVLRLDLGVNWLRSREFHLVPAWLQSLLLGLDRVACRSPVKLLGYHVFLLAERV